jgi:uncharacterized protein (DUF1800 family)
MSTQSPSQSVSLRTVDPAWAWSAYRPDAGHPWNLCWAGHLYRRAGFGGSWKQLQQSLADGPERSVEQLLRPTADVDAFNRTRDEYEALSVQGDEGGVDVLRDWWLRRILESPHPLLEKMTLFWHNHFAVNGAKVGSGLLMQRHLKLLRTQALGNYRALLAAVVRDGAMLLSVGATANYRLQTTDKLARPLLEVFALGPGQYTAQDVREAARALTGWFVFRHELRYVEREHDTGIMQILGQSGQFASDDLVRVLLQQPAAPRLIVRKLYRWLISEAEEPSDELLAPLGEAFAKDYDLTALVGTLLRSNLFFSSVAYRQRIKAPVELAVGIARALEAVVPTAPLAYQLTALGQNLGQPPTVHGWEGGRAWLNPLSLLGRNNLAAALLAESGPYGGKLDAQAIAARHGAEKSEAAAKLLANLFLQGDLPDEARAAILQMVSAPGDAAQQLRRVAYSLVTLPEYQLA